MRRSSYLKGMLGIVLSLLCIPALAQVTSFPYTYNFENFTTIQNSSSCTTTGSSIDDWTQITTDDGDWLADTNGTVSIGTGPGSTLTTSGVGVGTDYNPGTAGGRYLYTESTSCPGAEIMLLSPEFDLSDSSKYYRFKLAVHMFGTGMGALHIDVFSDGVWHNSEWSHQGTLDTVWQQITVDLAGYRDTSVFIRLRAITGPSFTSDIAIDDAIVEVFTPPSYDAVLVDMAYIPSEYSITALGHADSVRFIASVRNKGVKNITSTEVNITNGSYSATIDLDTVGVYQVKTDTTAIGFIPSSAGLYQFQYSTTINENDSFTNNNSGTVDIEYSDSVMARDIGDFNVGIGYNAGTGFQGSWFELLQDDTITSISVNLGENLGDSARVYLFNYDTAVGSMIAQSASFVIDSVRRWYTVRLKCEQVVAAGKYFIAVEQRTTGSNIGLGGTELGFTPQTSYYSGSGAIGSWTPIESAGFNVTYMIRMNMGKTILPNVQISLPSGTICEQKLVNLRATGADRYRWTPASAFQNATFANAFASFDSSQTITLTGTNSCGFSKTVSAFLTVEKGPTAHVPNDTTVCVDEEITLSGTTNNPYRWVNGPANGDYTVEIEGDTTFYMVVDSNNGCTKSYAIVINGSEVDLDVSDDTTLCSGNIVVLNSTGADSVKWDDGPWATSYSIVADTPKYYGVTAYNEFGCTDRDSIFVNSQTSPDLVVTPDTGICFRDSFYLTAYGADSIVWINGPIGNVYPIKVLKPASYEVRAYNTNGCFIYDTVDIVVYSPPFATIDDDTTVCEGETFTVSASGGDIYQWSNGEDGATIEATMYESAYLKVIVLNDEGCSDEDSLFVTVDPLPFSAFSVYVEDDSVQLSNLSTNATSYAWEFGDGENSTDESPFHIYGADGDYTITLTASNECGDHDTSIVVSIEIPVRSISSEKWISGISLYPNPASTELNIDLSSRVNGTLNISVVDPQGKIVRELIADKYSFLHHSNLDLSELSRGVYLLNIEVEGNKISRRFILH